MKKIVRLTEKDLHNVITCAVKGILKETIGQNSNYNVLNDIMKGEVLTDASSFSITPNKEENYCDIQVEGISGNIYWIRVWGGGEVDTPAEKGRFGGTIETDKEPMQATYNSWIEHIEIEKETELGQPNEIIPYSKNEEFEEWLYDMIMWDYDGVDSDLD